MDRRRYLTAAGVGLTLGIAGCTSDGSENTGDSGDTDEPEGTENPGEGGTESNETAGSNETPSSEATEAIEAAEEHLNEALTLILEEIDTAWAYSSTDASISTGGVEAALENANDSIEEADEAATTGSQQERVAEVELGASLVDQFLSVITALGEGINQISTAISYESNSRYEDAVESLTDAQTSFEEADSRVDDVIETFEELGEGTESDVDYATAEDAINEVEEVVTGYLLVIEAGIPFDRGLGDYTTAIDAFENEDYGTAANTFENALGHFEEAKSLYQEGEEEVTQSFRDTFITQTCYTGKYVEVVELMIDASEEADNGNSQEARDLAEEAYAVSFGTCG